MSAEAVWNDGIVASDYCDRDERTRARCVHLGQIAHLGGEATVRARGKEWMRQIGKIGFQALCDKHYGGRRQDGVNLLRAKGRLR